MYSYVRQHIPLVGGNSTAAVIWWPAAACNRQINHTPPQTKLTNKDLLKLYLKARWSARSTEKIWKDPINYSIDSQSVTGFDLL